MVKPHRFRKVLAATRRGFRAAGGDPKALARIGVAAARRAPRVAAAAALLFAGGAVLVATGFGTATGAPFGAGDQIWTAYQLSASVICQRGGGAMLWPPEVDTQPEGDRIDWRLIAALGEVSSAHAAGVSVNAFGDTLTPLVGQADRADTDGGRFDGSATADARVGPLALWPAEVASEGVDGNFDEIVDPHNVWDAAVTAAAALCTRGGADDPVGALLAWRSDRAWADRVLAAWDDIAFQAAAVTGPVPWGAPLAYTPRSAGGGGPVLAALVDRWAALGTAVTCEGGICGVKLGFVPENVAAWEGLLEAGYGAPAAVPNWGFTAAGDPTRHSHIVPWSITGLSWLFPPTPPPQPDTYSPPAWWTFALPPLSPAWTEPTEGYWLRIPAAAGTTVYAPTAGTAEYHAGGCVHIHDQDDARWELCGVHAHPGGTAPPPSGPLQRLLRDWPELERAARLTPPAVLVNLGTFACRTVHDSETWSPHSWNNAVDIAVDVDGDLDREQHDMDSATAHDALSRLAAALSRTMRNPHTSILEDGSTLIQDQAPQQGSYQIRNLVFNFDYQPGSPVSVVHHDEHVHVDFWVGPQPDEPDCAPHEVAAGDGIGVAPGGSVTVAVTGPKGARLCPQVLFRAWQRGDPLTPTALETELLAAEEAAAETADTEGADAADEPEEPGGCDE